MAIWLAKSRALEEELAHEGHDVFKDDLVMLHRVGYQKDTRKLLLQCISVKGKQVINKWGSKIGIKNVNPSDVMELHRATSEALSHTMDN